MQCYLLPYHISNSSGVLVLMGIKNIIGYKVKGKSPTQLIVWNNAGQWVISGGGKESTDLTEQEAAMREFFEETGVDFRKKEQLEYYGYHSTIETKKFTTFSVTYILFEDIVGMAGDINKNIQAKNVSDDELHEVQCIRLDAAKKCLGSPNKSESPWINSQIQEAKLKLENADKILHEQMNKPWDWFTTALKNLP